MWQHHTDVVSGDAGVDENSKFACRLRGVVGACAFPAMHADDVFLVPTGIPRTTQEIQGAFGSDNQRMASAITSR